MGLAGPQGAGTAPPISTRGSSGAHAEVVGASGPGREEDAAEVAGAWQDPGLEAGKGAPGFRCPHHVPPVHTLSLPCPLPEDAWSFLKRPL